MKRSVAVCITVGFVLAVSTTAFATPITGTWTWTAPAYDNTVSSGFTKVEASDHSYTFTWKQPYANATAPTLPSITSLGFDPAGTLTWGAPVVTIDSAVLTLKATGVSLTGEQVWRGTSTSSWVAQIGTLNLSPGMYGSGEGTTVITLSTPNAWLAPDGFYVQVRMPGTDQLNAMTKSQLQVSAHWDYGYSYEAPVVPPQPPVVPAPGALLLASLGAGVVSWMRARKAL